MNITYPQRLLLETIQRSPLTLEELRKVSGLNPDLLSHLLKIFLSQGLIKQDTKHVFHFAKNLKPEVTAGLTNKKNLEVEASEFMHHCVEEKLYHQNQDALQIKKISMTDKEYKIYRGLLYNLSAFLADVEKRGFHNKHNKIIFWGERSYENVIHHAFDY